MEKIKTVSVALVFFLISTLLAGCAKSSTTSLNDKDENVINATYVSANGLQEPTESEYNSEEIVLEDKLTIPAFKLDTDCEMLTELDFYLPETKRILVYWNNNSDNSLLFGDSWYLEKYNDTEWERMDTEVMFNSVGSLLSPNIVSKHVYWLTDYADSLSEGLYRIVTSYFYEDDIPVTPEKQYSITAEFTVTNDKSKIKRSELDYDDLDNSKDITPRELEQATSIRIYKDKHSFDTTVVIDDGKYEIGAGEGQWGVVKTSLYEADNRKYLIYTYSRAADTIISHIAVFDLQTLDDIFVSRAFSGFDLSFRTPLEGTVFPVSSLAHWESSEDGGHSDATIDDSIAYLVYEDGKFELEEAN